MSKLPKPAITLTSDPALLVVEDIAKDKKIRSRPLKWRKSYRFSEATCDRLQWLSGLLEMTETALIEKLVREEIGRITAFPKG